MRVVINGTGFAETMQYYQAGESGGYVGLLKRSVDFEGRQTLYTYDAQGRLSTKTHSAPGSNTRTVTYTYDALGRTHSISDTGHGPSGGTTTYQYDAEGRQIQVASPEGIVNYHYNDLGQLDRTWTGNTLSSLDSGTPHTETAYTYDALGRLATVTQSWRAGVDITDEETSYTYDVIGNLDKQVSGGGVVADYDYDRLNRLTQLTHFKDTNANFALDAGEWKVAQFNYTLDSAGNRLTAVERFDADNDTGTGSGGDGLELSQSFAWKYDALNRLVEEAFDADGTTDDYVVRYAFDLASNRKTLAKDSGNAAPANFTADQTTTYAYDANDRLTQEVKDAPGTADDTNTVYTYGPSDSQTTQTGKTVREGTTPGSGTITEQHTFSYDVMGRMVSTTIDKTGSGGTVTTTTYQYNANGLRVRETTGSETRTYLFDLNNPTGFAQAIEEHLNGTLDKTYTLGHDVIAQYDSTNGLLHLLYDGHGSTRAVLNPAAALVQRYTYDAYGVMLTAPGLTTAAAALTRLLYSGEHTNANGTQYLRARWYDPSTGRFNRLDPFAGNASDPVSLHKYLYTHGNPVMGIDPTGNLELSVSGLLAGIAVVSLVNGLVGAGIGIVRAGARGAVGGFVGAWVASTYSLVLTPVLSSFVTPAFGVPLAFGIGSLVGTADELTIVEGVEYLSSFEGKLQLGISLGVGIALGVISQGSTLHLARSLGEKLVSYADIRSALAEAAAGRGVHMRSFSKFALYAVEHPIEFGKLIFDKLFASDVYPTFTDAFITAAEALAIGNLGSQTAQALAPAVVASIDAINDVIEWVEEHTA